VLAGSFISVCAVFIFGNLTVETKYITDRRGLRKWVLKNIHYLNKGNKGVVLAGNSIIYQRINSRNDTLYAQIVCRIGIRKHIFGKIAKSDIESLFEQKKLSTRCTDYLHQLANGKGGLTYMIKIYLLAEAAARSHKEELDVSLQFVRKLTGFNQPSKTNEAAFEHAVNDIAAIARILMDSLVTYVEPRNREVETERARARNVKRFG
jgi:hypothetical protein